MFLIITAAAERLRLAVTRVLARFGFREESFLLILAILIGVVTAAAAVTFHELILGIRGLLYNQLDARFLYGKGIALLIVLPALGGLIVGIVSQYVAHAREGHGIVDVIESIIRSRGFIKPGAAVEKIVTSAVTIGTGGSAGAEGPIVQIGAAIASGVGQLFRVARQHMPILLGCGSAAGISAIFNSPIGGVLFTLEVLLYDFSIRTFAPLVLASVIANVTTQAIFRQLLGESYGAIFSLPAGAFPGTGGEANASYIDWAQLPNFAVLGLICGFIGVCLSRLMYSFEERFSRLPIPKVLRPAFGGAILGLIGVLYVMIFGWWMLGQPKPFAFQHYPLPAFFGDGYGVIKQLLDAGFYSSHNGYQLFLLLLFLCAAKLFGTCMTLASGGSGGIIAPSVFLGAVVGGILGIILRATGHFSYVQPSIYALIGMGAVLASVVHAPMASILILLELTRDYRIILPAMLASIIAIGIARMVMRDSIYTLSLRHRGVRVGTASDFTLLRRMNVEQVPLEPAIVVRGNDPLQRVLDLSIDTGVDDFIVMDSRGNYEGMITADDIKTALLQREAVPLLLVDELTRPDVPLVKTSDDLASVFNTFSLYNVSHLPVCISPDGGKVIGLISRKSLMQCYQKVLAES